MLSNFDTRGALVTLRGNSGRDVLTGMVSKQQRRWSGSANALTTRFSRGILVRSVAKCKARNAAYPSGSSRNRVTASASQTTVRVTQSKTKNPDSPLGGVCLGHGQLVDVAGSALVALTTTSLPTHRHVQVLNAVVISKTGEVNTPNRAKSLGRSAIATAARRLRGVNGDHASSPTRLWRSGKC